MASPQKENGYTAIANELLEAISRFDFTAGDYKIILCLIRKTYGYHKKADVISLSQFAGMTGLNRIHCFKILKRLVKAKIFAVSNHANREPASYCLQKDYEKWQPLKKHSPVCNYANISNYANSAVCNSVQNLYATVHTTKDIKKIKKGDLIFSSENQNQKTLSPEQKKELHDNLKKLGLHKIGKEIE